MAHPAVQHPKELLKQEIAKPLVLHDKILDWLSEHLLASRIMFDIAFIIPLLVIRAPDTIKITLGVISGSWIQWWALPALQRSNIKADALRQAKADADHASLTHIAETVDAIKRKVSLL